MDELKKVLDSHNLNEQSEVFNKIMEKFDTSGDQEIDFEEFRQMIETLGIISS